MRAIGRTTLDEATLPADSNPHLSGVDRRAATATESYGDGGQDDITGGSR